MFEITGAPEKIEAFAELMRPLGLVEVARTGVAALARGSVWFFGSWVPPAPGSRRRRGRDRSGD